MVCLVTGCEWGTWPSSLVYETDRRSDAVKRIGCCRTYRNFMVISDSDIISAAEAFFASVAGQNKAWHACLFDSMYGCLRSSRPYHPISHSASDCSINFRLRFMSTELSPGPKDFQLNMFHADRMRFLDMQHALWQLIAIEYVKCPTTSYNSCGLTTFLHSSCSQAWRLRDYRHWQETCPQYRMEGEVLDLQGSL